MMSSIPNFLSNPRGKERWSRPCLYKGRACHRCRWSLAWFLHVGMEPPTAMKNIGKILAKWINMVQHIDQWYAGSGIWNILKLPEIESGLGSDGSEVPVLWVKCQFDGGQDGSNESNGWICQRLLKPGSQALLRRFSRSQSPIAVGKPRYVHGKTRRSGHSATAGLCKAWWLQMGGRQDLPCLFPHDSEKT